MSPRTLLTKLTLALAYVKDGKRENQKAAEDLMDELFKDILEEEVMDDSYDLVDKVEHSVPSLADFFQV